MKRVLLMNTAVLVFAGSVQARLFGRDGCAERCAIYVPQGIPRR
jgi:hypothetical protein